MTTTDQTPDDDRDRARADRAIASASAALGQAIVDDLNTLPLEARLARVLGRVSAAPKSGYNSQHRYNYTTEQDVLDQVREALAAEGVSFEYDVDDVVEMQATAGSGTAMHVCRVFVLFTLRANGESRTTRGYGYGSDTAEKAYSKAITSAVKTYTAKTFLIAYSDGDDTAELEPAAQRASARSTTPTPAPTLTVAPPELVRGKTTDPTRRAWAWGKAGAGAAFQAASTEALHALRAAAPDAWGEIPIDEFDRTCAEKALAARGEAVRVATGADVPAPPSEPQNAAHEPEAEQTSPDADPAATCQHGHDLDADGDCTDETCAYHPSNEEPDGDGDIDPNAAAALALAANDAAELANRGMPELDTTGHAVTRQAPMLDETRRRLENALINSGKAADRETAAGIVEDYARRGFGQPWGRAELERATASGGEGIDADPATD